MINISQIHFSLILIFSKPLLKWGNNPLAKSRKKDFELRMAMSGNSHYLGYPGKLGMSF